MNIPNVINKFMVFTAVVIFTSLSAVMVQAESDSDLVNLARLSIARVTASSVNGTRDYDNPFHGVLNLFDDGAGYQTNNLNYTTWLTDNEQQHWVKIKFSKPVKVYSVIVESLQTPKSENRNYVESPTQYALKLVQLKNGKKTELNYDSIPVNGFRTTYSLSAPADSISELTLIFPGSNIIELSEIEVMGRAPGDTDITPQKPSPGLNINQFRYEHSVNIERTVKDAQELHILKLAEQISPALTDILKAVIRAGDKSVENSYVDHQWWYKKTNDILIPYCITDEAVQYFENLVNGYASEYKNNKNPTGSRLEYTAVIKKLKKSTNGDYIGVFREGYSIRMKLSYGAYLNNGKGISFKKEREMVVDPDGKLISVKGDGVTVLSLE